jgi:threonine/homoserine/homoserine lactone efflux protein
MLENIVLGGGFAFAAAVQPGPLQAYLLSQVAARGWRRTLPAALAPLVSDGPIAILVLLVLGQLSVGAQGLLRAAGGALLLYLAWSAYHQWRRPPQTSADGAGTPRTVVQAVLVNLLNPNPYLGWALVLGPNAVAAWHRSPADAVALIVAFYAVLVAGLAGFIVAAGSVRFLGPRGQRVLVLVSAAVLAALGVYQLAASVWPTNLTRVLVR